VIIAHKAVLFVDIREAVREASEMVCVLTLHLGLNYINRVVAHR
jgi:hypothetical protein